MIKRLYIWMLCFAIWCITLDSVYSSAPHDTLRIAFYNIENAYDSIDDSLEYDDDFSPRGKKLWTSTRYKCKIENISHIISSISPSIIGLCEIENENVLRDICKVISSKTHKKYNFITMDSGDERGLDPAVIYDEDILTHVFSDTISSPCESRAMMESRYIIKETGDTLDVLVCHWTSRYMGRKATENARISLARRASRWANGLPSTTLKLIMGDFNDQHSDVSLSYLTHLAPYMNSHHRDNNYSYYYQGKWYAFDQIFTNFVPSTVPYTSYKENIMMTDGKYPYRTYTGDRHIGGYSDHLPVYIDYDVKHKQ